jgi:hypothetical protein
VKMECDKVSEMRVFQLLAKNVEVRHAVSLFSNPD